MAAIEFVRPDVPTPRSVVDALPRPRLFTVLEQQSSLTVVQAPKGFGKRTLVASWLHDGGAADREVVWIDAGDERRRDEIAFGGGPGLIVVAGVEPDGVRDALEKVLGILERCPTAIAVVTVHGAVEIPLTLASRGLDHRWLSAEQLCFTADETAELCRLRGLEITDERSTELWSALGGVPPLVASAAALLRIPPVARVDADTRLVPALERVVGNYVEQRMSGLGDEACRFALKLAAARTSTATEAAEITGTESSETLLERLDATGLVIGAFDGAQRRWTWPTAVREVVLGNARAEIPEFVDRTLGRLASKHLAARRYADAAAYAVDAREWEAAARILDEHWNSLAADDFEVFVQLLRSVPDAVADEYPGLVAGKALLGNARTGHSMLGIEIPSEPDELAMLGAGPEAAEVLRVGTVQAIALRMAGSLREGSDRAQSLVPLVESMLAHQPGNVTPQLPTIRLQWAIGMQLAGDLAEATTQFEQAYRDAAVAGFDFVVLNAAGSIAADWALLGDPMRVDEWLAAEARADTSVGYWDAMIRVGGRVAASLTYLDRLDFDSAKTVLDVLGVPSSGEELWGLIAYVHAQHALVTGAAYSGLTGLHRIVDGHRGLHQPGSASQVLLTAAEIDLNLALGNGNLARAIAEADTTGHPLIVVAAARAELLTGHPDTARAVLTRISWPDSGWLRAHAEALLIEAAACLPGDRDGAVRAWNRAGALAESLGNRRVLTTVSARIRQELAAAAGGTAPDDLPADVFPDAVPEVVLSVREREVLAQLDHGVARKDLSDKLFVSQNTIKTQLRSIYQKLEVHSATAALTRARELRLLT